jgi:hypothetical protein
MISEFKTNKYDDGGEKSHESGGKWEVDARFLTSRTGGEFKVTTTINTQHGMLQ